MTNERLKSFKQQAKETIIAGTLFADLVEKWQKDTEPIRDELMEIKNDKELDDLNKNKMNKFKTLTHYTLYTVLACVFSSCSYPIENYPKYSLETIKYVPDTLKVKHRTWITETIRAASQYVTGGDYEDVDVTIRQAKWTADDLFQVSVVGLRKEVNDNYYDDFHLKPTDLNAYERKVLDSLVNAH